MSYLEVMPQAISSKAEKIKGNTLDALFFNNLIRELALSYYIIILKGFLMPSRLVSSSHQKNCSFSFVLRNGIVCLKYSEVFLDAIPASCALLPKFVQPMLSGSDFIIMFFNSIPRFSKMKSAICFFQPHLLVSRGRVCTK